MNPTACLIMTIVLALALMSGTVIVFVLLRRMQQTYVKQLEDFRQEEQSTRDALARSENRYEKLIMNMNEGLIFTDDKDMIRFANKSACQLLKLDESHLVNRSILDFVISPMDARKLGLPYELKRTGAAHREEVQLLKGNGDLFWASLNISYMDSLHDHMPGAIIVINDISTQKQHQEKLHLLSVSMNHKGKQLDCMYETDDITSSFSKSLEEVNNRLLHIIPPALKFGNEVWVEIMVGELRQATRNYKDSRFTYTAPVTVNGQKYGTIRVGYADGLPAGASEAFLVNEKMLLRHVAERLGHWICHTELLKKTEKKG